MKTSKNIFYIKQKLLIILTLLNYQLFYIDKTSFLISSYIRIIKKRPLELVYNLANQNCPSGRLSIKAREYPTGFV